MVDIISNQLGQVLSSTTDVDTQVGRNQVTVTTTTTVDVDGGTWLTDVNYIPFMRGIPIDFIGYSLRPTRQIHYYFDDRDMSHFIQRPNVIELDTKASFRGIESGRRESVIVNSSNAVVYLNETSVSTGNSRLFLTHFGNPTSPVQAGDTVTGLNSGAIGNVVSYLHQSGVAQSGSGGTTLILAEDAEGTTDDYYVGNVITILESGISANITDYVASTRTATVSPSLGTLSSNSYYSIGDSRSPYSSNSRQGHWTTERGFVPGTLWIPDPFNYPDWRFQTGDRIFRVLDNNQNDTNDYSTRADYRFKSHGLEVETTQIVNRTVTTDVATTNIRVVPPPPPPPPPQPRERGGCCFIGEALVTMADGSQKRIDEVQVGDKVIGLDGAINNVTGVETPLLENRMLYKFNDEKAFVSEEHPFYTKDGWAAFDPDSWAIENHLIDGKKVTKKIVMGTELLHFTDNVSEWVRVELIGYVEADPNTQLYNLLLDGNHTYIVEGYLVHNKDDPTAQQFFVPQDKYPEGIFVTSVELFFKNKDAILPVEVQLRPMVNGLPDSYHILPNAVSIKQPEDVNISDLPDVDDPATATKFEFNSPVYLAPGRDYCFVVLTNSFNYDFFVAELGGTVLGTTRKVSEQPYLGSMFKSQNAVTYTPIQSETVMFKINKAKFVSQGSVVFNEQKLDNYNVGTKGNTVMDLFQVHSDVAELPGTTVDFSYKATTNANSTLDAAYTSFRPDVDIDLPVRKVVYTPGVPTKSWYMKVDMATDNTDVSPFLWKNRQSLVAVENIINNMGITEDNLSIVSGGTGYATGTTSLSFTGPSGSGANGYVSAVSGGAITEITMDAIGSGYWDNVTCTVVGAGSGADIVVNTETGSSGGQALARQISKPVTLKDGFDAGDLSTYLTISKPAQANVQVYYRVLNSLDGDTIDDKGWTRMEQKTSGFTYSKNLEPIEYEFRPSLTSNNVTYTGDDATYNIFNQFQVKIVLASSSTNSREIPYVHDARTIAMPADEF